MTASCSILLAIGQALFQVTLRRNLLRVVSQDEADRLIAVGAADVSRAIRPVDRDAVIDAYNNALTDVFVSSNRRAEKSLVMTKALNSFFPPWGPLSPFCWSVV